MKSDTKAILFLVLVVLAILVVSVFAFMDSVEDERKNKPEGCPEDTRMCADGSQVVRVLPDCMFQKCPGEP